MGSERADHAIADQAGEAPRRFGVVGAGTMGAGIARAAGQAGLETVLVDVDREALARVAAKAPAVATSTELAALERCDVVVEAVPERFELKAEVLAKLSAIAPGAVLGTNTSSFSIAALSQAAAGPDRVVGMHFFNPVHRMRLLELVAAPATSVATLERARAAGEMLGKRVIVAADGPGFLVNRCARPFYLEACRIVEDGVATTEQVDRICRDAGGYPMGPFELMDLIGLDVSLAVSRSMWEQSFGEPRWRPSRLQARLVAAGRLGRKTGGGFHDGPHEPRAAPPPEAQPAPAPSVAVVGGDALAGALRERATARGVVLAPPDRADSVLVTERRLIPDGVERRRIAVACGDGAARPLSGFGLVPPLRGLVEVTDHAHDAAFLALGLAPEQVGDRPGLVLGAIVAQLVNEAAFAVGEGIGSKADADLGATLGLNHPRGPFEWCEAIGADRVAAVLDALWRECHDDRYRMAPSLRAALPAAHI